MPEDQLAAIEWQGEQDLKCSSCGHPRDETMRDEEDPRRPRYKAEALVCAACEAAAVASRGAAEDNEGQPLHGWHWFVTAERRNGAG